MKLNRLFPWYISSAHTDRVTFVNYTLFLGSSKLPVKKIEEVMNEYGKDGWDVSFQVIEKSRMWLFWEREALIVTFVKDL